MELKFITQFKRLVRVNRSNRTFMELKSQSTENATAYTKF